MSGLGKEWAERNCKVLLSKYCVDDGHDVIGCKPHLVFTGEGVRLQTCMGCERMWTLTDNQPEMLPRSAQTGPAVGTRTVRCLSA